MFRAYGGLCEMVFHKWKNSVLIVDPEDLFNAVNTRQLLVCCTPV